jgi:tRNA pseudouridine55 synthase
MLCVGKATRLQQYLLAWPKTYCGEIRLGFATATYDAEGEPLAEPRPVPALTPETLAELQARFSGEQQQLPPPYSAKKAAGRKFYELARAGEEVPLEPKRVTLHSVVLERAAEDRIAFEVSCSSGTYVRSLAHDLGEALGCGGHLAKLRRTRIGPWDVARAVSGEVLAQRPKEIDPGAFVLLSERVLPVPEVTLNPTALDHFVHGQEVVVRDVAEMPATGGQVVVRDRNGELAGIGVALSALPRARTLTVAPRMVFTEVEATVKP